MGTSAVSMPRGLSIAIWGIQLLLAAAFFAAGGAKLLGVPRMVGVFDAIGAGQWFRYVTGVVEVGAAVLLLLPAWCGLGAALLVPTMIGAALAQWFLIGGGAGAALLLLALASIVAWTRRDRGLSWLTPGSGRTTT